MAGVTRSGNTIYVDGTGIVTAQSGSLTVIGVILSPATHGSGTPTIVLTDQAPSASTKLKVCGLNTTTVNIPLADTPIQFYGGISVSSLSGAVATIIIAG